MNDLKFDQKKIARIYTAFRYQNQSVVMNPNFRFGEPIVEENGYPADVLWRGVVSEGSFERAAELYDASVSSVEAAYRYCNGELGCVHDTFAVHVGGVERGGWMKNGFYI